MFPAIPRGATIPSILLACEQTGRVTSMRQRVSGFSLKHSLRLMDYQDNPSVLTKNIFAGELTFHDLVLNHTVSPIYLSLVDRGCVTDPIRLSQLAWSACESYCGDDVSLYSRLCPLCVEEDREKFGCGHWRREHQINSVLICMRHLSPVHEKCATPHCGVRLAEFGRGLPDKPCPYCHGTETSSFRIGTISAGYLAFCKLFVDALEMRIPELDPATLDDLLTFAYDLCNGDINAVSHLMTDWLGDQAAVLREELKEAERFLLLGYFLNGPVQQIAPSLILLTAFKRTLLGAPPASEAICWAD